MHSHTAITLTLLLLTQKQEFDPDCIRDFLQQLTPDRARVTWATRLHEQQPPPPAPQEAAREASSADASSSSDSGGLCGLATPSLCSEPIYGTLYHVQPLPQPWLQAWSNGVPIPGLHLPEVNPFVPDDLSLLSGAAAGGPKEGLPVVLLESGGVRLWQRTDLRFENPKATIVLDFQVCVRMFGVLVEVRAYMLAGVPTRSLICFAMCMCSHD